MRFARAAFLLSFLCSATFPSISFAGLEDLTQLAPGRSHRSSTSEVPNWQDGNADARPIEPGDTLVLADLEGPGIVNHLWFTINAVDGQYPASLVLRVYYDDREQPGVEAPLGDFFGIGHGLVKAYQCAVYEISSDGRAYNSFWKMPFARRFRMTVTNESDRRVNSFYSYVDWLRVPALPKDTAYFHAQYRQEKPCVSGKNYLLLETEGRGHYVGTVLSVHHAEEGWFGEGDDFFFIDGEQEPSLKGTGSEDYFCDAWGFREFQQMRHGVTQWEWGADGRGTAYRWHTDDPIHFEKSLRVEIEHKGSRHDPQTGKAFTGFAERADDFASVAFWYQTGEPTRFADWPPLSERIKPVTTLEAEASEGSIEFASGALQMQEGNHWSGNRHVFYLAQKPGDWLKVPFQVEKDWKEASLRLKMTTSWDYGIYEVSLDDSTETQTLNLYSQEVLSKEVRLGVLDLSAGEHVLGFKCVGADPKSKLLKSENPGYYMGLDAILLSEVPRGFAD
jgi:hypothetical protein